MRRRSSAARCAGACRSNTSERVDAARASSDQPKWHAAAYSLSGASANAGVRSNARTIDAGPGISYFSAA